MARGNMIVTLVANTKAFSTGLQKAGKSAINFGTVLRNGFGLAFGAITALGGALFTFLPNLIRMGEESRRSERRLAQVAKQMGIFGKDTLTVTNRLSEYAEKLAFATGIDDELIRGNQAILLTFKALAKSADTVGGAFDRATVATLDIAEVMQTDSVSAARQLGKVLQDPIKHLGSLSKAGVTFTEQEREKIRELVESNKLLEAQSLILDAIETQVGGTAEASASAMERIRQRFESVAEEIVDPLLPAIDDLATQMGDWLDSVEGQKAIADLTKQLEDFGDWVTSPAGEQAVKDFANSMVALANASIEVGKGIQSIYEAFKALSGIPRWLLELVFSDDTLNSLRSGLDAIQNPTTPTPELPVVADRPSTRPITVNFNTPVDSVSAGREIARVLADYNRAGGRQ